MKPTRITLVGPGLAGRRASLSWFLRRTIGEAASPVFDNQDRTAVINRVPCVISVASLRSQYGDAAAPGVEEEFERLASSAAFLYVVDSQRERTEAGLHQLERLRSDLASRGIDLDTIPVVFQLNKRDLKNVSPVADLQNAFKTGRCRYIESIAPQGRGVVEAFETVLAMVESP